MGTMIRHVLLDNHWELQCPVCRQFVSIDVDVMQGRSPFPTHTRWSPSWTHLLSERYPRLRSWFWRQEFITAERLLRRFVREPKCSYRETYNWRNDLPSTGVSALGPLEA